ncbi:hypothetical protein E2C01_034779 [Portunus trituberculatus]|uniref:Uncharacterized protein n=1 Tax=Portunus trituberculatus TaxID=210409 RepID=A0A5B7F3Q9_PORTR|nr:hypothetical protein [Portunus trituberculatus]
MEDDYDCNVHKGSHCCRTSYSVTSSQEDVLRAAVVLCARVLQAIICYSVMSTLCMGTKVDRQEVGSGKGLR